VSFVDGEGPAKYLADPVFPGSLDGLPGQNDFAAAQRFIDVLTRR
jgi:hypothetical protein